MGNGIVVALGGGLGALCRYGMSQLPLPGAFPLATFLTNFLGAVLIGFLTGLAEIRELPPRVMLLGKTGFCGGFTTFSTFSLESVAMLSGGRYGLAGAYLAGSVACCLAGVVVGQMAARAIG